MKVSDPSLDYDKTYVMTTNTSDPEMSKWAEELAFFNSIQEDLLTDKAYKNKYVAIKDKKLIDSDADDFRLVERIDSKYPNDVVLVVKVEADVPIAEIPSPEF